MKLVQVTFSNGEVWRIKANEIADKYACTHSSRGVVRGDAEWQTSYENVLDDDVLLIEFASDMLWSGFEEHAFRVKQPDPMDYDDEWPMAEKSIIHD